MRRAGERIHLEKQPFDLLLLLVERRDQLVTHTEIVERLLGSDVFVETEQSVHSAIAKIRRALSDDPRHPTFVETVAGTGYRFIGPVTVIDGATRAAVLPVEPAANRRFDRWRWPAGAAAVAVLLSAVIVGWIRFEDARTASAPISSIAVLPLDNLSGSPDQQYLADAITDQLTTDLATVESLRVVSRTSAMQYRGAHDPLPVIARKLHVDAIVEGSVVRSADNIRITAQLIDARTDRHLWAGSFEGRPSDVLAVEERVARAISDRVQHKLRLQPARLEAAKSINPRAYDSYLRARYFFDKRTAQSLQNSVHYYRDTIAIEPSFAPAYAGLAEALPVFEMFSGRPVQAVLPEAQNAASRAVSLDDSLAEAHSALGTLLLLNWNWSGAETQLRRAVALTPNSPLAHEELSMWCLSANRIDEALQESETAQRLDPLSFFLNRDLGFVLMYSHRYEEALAQFHRAAELEPNSSASSRCLSMVYALQGKRDVAIQMDLKELSEDGVAPRSIAALRLAYKNAGWTGYWSKRRDVQTVSHLGAYGSAIIEAHLGNADAVWRFMEESANRREQWATWIRVDPSFDGMRDHPAFQRLVQRMNLPGR